MECSIIIVNYNTAELVKQCIDSLLMQTGISFEIFVVDNASHDHSLEILHSYGTQIHLLANSDNVGSGRANNQAIRLSKGRYLFLINPDAILKTSTDLYHLIRAMDDHPEYGLAGTRIITNHRETLPRYYYPGQKYLKLDFSHLPGAIAWVIGASMIIRREVFEKIKGFDERYFLYGEEVDLCLRIRQQGYTIGYLPEITVVHVGGASEKRSSIDQTWRRKQAGLHQFIKQYYPPTSAVQLVKKHERRARHRLRWLHIQSFFKKLSPKKLSKLQRYNVVCETSQEFLSIL